LKEVKNKNKMGLINKIEVTISFLSEGCPLMNIKEEAKKFLLIKHKK